MSKYEGKDNYGKPKADYLTKIAGMDTQSLLKETENKIWLSAFAANNPRSDYHWHVDACYDEWGRRGTPEKYAEAYESAKASCGL